jgi:hypothetical protein
VKWWRDKNHFVGRHKRGHFTWLLASAMLLAVATVWACSHSSRWLLSDTDETVMAVPRASFFKEIALWKRGAKSQFKTSPPKEAQTHAQQVAEAEEMELAEALRKTDLPAAQRDVLLARSARLRTHLRDCADKLAAWQSNPYDWENNRQNPRPQFLTLPVPEGLPPEFADYLRGALAYYAGQSNVAYTAWTGLLQRPPADRHYRSTWAEYMLGRLLLETSPEQAVVHYARVRELAQAGYADSLGLAGASLGWEARGWLLLKNHKRALELYSEQISAGDDHHAVISLQRTVKAAFGQSDAAVRVLAQDPQCRRIVTAALISRDLWLEPLINPEVGDAAAVWLGILEETGAVDVALAEQLALAAYQSGRFDLAERWLNRAPNESAIARWVRSKLLMRAGKLDEAAQVLAQLLREFPVSPEHLEAEVESPELLDRVRIYEFINSYPGHAYGRQEITAEFAVLQLSRRDFVSSLDCFVRSGFWSEAAHVAERVLTLAELKTYVDRTWQEEKRAPDDQGGYSASTTMRELLARRLARANRWPEARTYFSPETRPLLDKRMRLLTRGHEANLPKKQRADALWEAALLTYESGSTLLRMSTEGSWIFRNEPDQEYDIERRWQQQTNLIAKTAREELLRIAQNEAPPNDRRNYRYLAADLAWETTLLMPDQSETTARRLYEAGSWLKHQDAKSANRFYKALVLRCNKTELGALAEKMRWFPRLDQNGKPFIPERVPKEKRMMPESESFPVF